MADAGMFGSRQTSALPAVGGLRIFGAQPSAAMPAPSAPITPVTAILSAADLALPPLPMVANADSAELTDAELENVAGGLARTWHDFR